MTLPTLGHFDPLTRLLNRRGFLRAGDQLLAGLSGLHCGAAVHFIDVDGLQRINDAYGHAEGDEILRRTAGVMRETFRSVDVLARIHGDEFAALTLSCGPGDVESVSARLAEALQVENVRRAPPVLSLSLVHAPVNPTHPGALEDILRYADTAMYGYKISKLLDLELAARSSGAH